MWRLPQLLISYHIFKSHSIHLEDQFWSMRDKRSGIEKEDCHLTWCVEVGWIGRVWVADGLNGNHLVDPVEPQGIRLSVLE